MPKPMTGQERVQAAFAHAPMDRVPMNYSANPGIDARLKAHFGLSANDDEGLLRALDIDFRDVDARYTGPVLHRTLRADRPVDPIRGTVTRWIEHPSGGYDDYCDFPLIDATLEDIERWPVPSADDYDYDDLRAQCERYRGYGVSIHFFGAVINSNAMLRGMEQTLVDLITDDPVGVALYKKRLGARLAYAERAMEATRGLIDFVWLSEDLGSQDKQLISMDIFRKHIRPTWQPFCDLARAYGTRVMFHTCGCSSWAYEDFIEMGVDCVDTLQPEARRMSPRELLADFGQRLSYHGCISTAGALAHGTPEQVAGEVRDTLEVMMPSNGYMLSPTHMIQDNSPTENVLAMYEAGLRYGKY